MSCAANIPSGSEAYGKLYPEKSSDGVCYMPCAYMPCAGYAQRIVLLVVVCIEGGRGDADHSVHPRPAAGAAAATAAAPDAHLLSGEEDLFLRGCAAAGNVCTCMAEKHAHACWRTVLSTPMCNEPYERRHRRHDPVGRGNARRIDVLGRARGNGGEEPAL